MMLVKTEGSGTSYHLPEQDLENPADPEPKHAGHLKQLFSGVFTC